MGWPRDASLPIMGALLRRISGAFFEFKYKKRESDWSVAERDDGSLEPAAGHRSARCWASAGGGRTVEPGSLLSGATRRPPEPAILGNGCAPHSARRCKAACARGLDRRSAPCLPINRSPAGEISVFKRRIFGAVEKTRTSTGFRPQRPQRCASTNSATAAREKNAGLGRHLAGAGP